MDPTVFLETSSGECPNCGYYGKFETTGTTVSSVDKAEFEISADGECPECGQQLEWYTATPSVTVNRVNHPSNLADEQFVEESPLYAQEAADAVDGHVAIRNGDTTYWVTEILDLTPDGYFAVQVQPVTGNAADEDLIEIHDSDFHEVIIVTQSDGENVDTLELVDPQEVF